MVRVVLPVLALAVAAAANPLVALEHLVKRQSTADIPAEATGQIQGLIDLANQVLSSSGNLTQECTQWATELQTCYGQSSDQVAVATCACGESALSAMTSCANGYGSTGTEDASGFSTFCTQTLPSLVGGNSTVSSAVSSAAESATGVVESLSTALSSAASASSSSLSSAISSQASAASSSASAAGAAATGSGNGAAQLAAGGVTGILATLFALAL
ncbi:hypothetical protein JCM8097_008010 [Rhodosporidiobolus ruineniae]